MHPSTCRTDEEPPVISPKKGAGLVCQKHTDVIVTEFENKILIIATQMEKIGLFVEVFIDSVVPEPALVLYDSKVLFGRDEPEIHAVARSLSERFKFPKTVLYGLGLTEYSAASVKGLGDLLAEILTKPEETGSS